MSTRTCDIIGCEMKHHTKGFCYNHHVENKRKTSRRANRPTLERLLCNIFKDEKGCWLWLGSTHGVKTHQYGKLKVKGRSISAHRLMWEQKNGDIPSGLCVLHTCDVPACINPEHLFLGTIMDNTIDMMNKGRGHFQQ